jgi:hypothetical protein
MRAATHGTPAEQRFYALVDTGCQQTVISPKVAEVLDLDIVGQKVEVLTADQDSPLMCDQTYAHISILGDHGAESAPLEVMPIISPILLGRSRPIFIGMDALERGVFVVDGPGGTWSLGLP